MFPKKVVEANMNNQDYKQTDIVDVLSDMLRQIQNLNSKLERIESHNTKA